MRKDVLISFLEASTGKRSTTNPKEDVTGSSDLHKQGRKDQHPSNQHHQKWEEATAGDRCGGGNHKLQRRAKMGDKEDIYANQ